MMWSHVTISSSCVERRAVVPTKDATIGDASGAHRARVPPSYRPDIYTTEAILDPYPHYRRLRDLGPVVWMPRRKVYALPRYAECKAALIDDETFRSSGGVALNSLSNRLSQGHDTGQRRD